ncbi:MAG: acyltransferase [Nocardioidaceae bacterium]|nr:acyltransferase [Nocardioidaceae bacterium]
MTTTPASTAARAPRLRSLDALRLVAALAVVAFHFTARENVAWGTAVENVFPRVGEITAYGYLGVHVFFLISGFVILMSAWGADVGRFAASRVGRLYPAYWAGVLLTAALILVVRPETAGSRVDMGVKEVLVNLTMVQRALDVRHVDGVYWTLWVELKFYLLVGLFVWIGITRARVLLVCALWPLLAIIGQLNGVALANDLLQPDYAPLFAIGMLLYLVHREGWSATPLLLIVLNWLVVVQKSDGPYLSSFDGAVAADLNGTVVAAGITLGLLAVVVLTTTRLQHLDARWMTTAGVLTYPLYLVHEEIGWWFISLIRQTGLPVPAVLVLALAAVLLLAAAIHHGIEKPLCSRLRRAVHRSIESAPTPR